VTGQLTAPSACPDWTALVAGRDTAGERGEAAWRQALVHLDACPGCRRSALAAEPTLLFRALPRVEVAGSEAAAMRDAVASMRRARRVAPESPLARAAARVSARRLPASPLGRRGRGLAAAALLAAASGGLWAALPAADPPPAAATAAPGEAESPALRRALPANAAPSLAEPDFMDLSLPRSADVYRVGNGGLQVVMVVDERLDV
jgi:hypothetical protein